MRNVGATLVAAALVLFVAAPASAVTGGFGIAKALTGKPLPVSFTADGQARKVHACNANGGQAKKQQPKHAKVAEQLTGKFVPVACEQPPRSELNANALRNATAAALAVLG